MAAMPSMLERTKCHFRQKGWTRTILSGQTFIAIWLLAACTEASSGAEVPHRSGTPAEQSLRVRFQEGLLSLEARHTPWKQVLTVIQQKSGIRFHPGFPLTGSVSVSVPALPVMRALERLFGPKAGFTCRYPMGAAKGPAVPREVWILGQVREGGVVPPKAGKLGVFPTPPDLAGLYSNAATEADATASANQGADVIPHLTRMVKDADPGTRVQALSALAQSDNGKAVEIESALETALDDADPNVRGAALQALMDRGGPKAMERLRQALQDPDPGVRMLAVGSAASGQAGRLLLDEALSDTDETVRVMATERLKREPGHAN